MPVEDEGEGQKVILVIAEGLNPNLKPQELLCKSKLTDLKPGKVIVLTLMGI